MLPRSTESRIASAVSLAAPTEACVQLRYLSLLLNNGDCLCCSVDNKQHNCQPVIFWANAIAGPMTEDPSTAQAKLHRVLVSIWSGVLATGCQHVNIQPHDTVQESVECVDCCYHVPQACPS